MHRYSNKFKMITQVHQKSTFKPALSYCEQGLEQNEMVISVIRVKLIILEYQE